MQMDGYRVVCEFFNSRKDEKELGSYRIMDLSIYKGDKLTTKRYLTARLAITNRKLVVDRLSKVSIVPLIADVSEIARHIVTHPHAIWKSVNAFEIPYRFLKDVGYDPETKSFKIETLIDDTTVFMKFSNTERVSKEIMKTLDKLDI